METKKILQKIGKQGFSYLSPKVKIGKSLIEGKGVFAKELIKKGEVVNIWNGIIVSEKEYEELYKNKSVRKILEHYTTEIEDNFYIISGLKEGDLEGDDFFNHSCDPNLGIRGQIMVVAMRDIKPGEELAYDYAMVDSDPEDSFKCNCRAENCRGKFTGNDWKKPELQKKYKGYFS